MFQGKIKVIHLKKIIARLTQNLSETSLLEETQDRLLLNIYHAPRASVVGK